MQARVAARVVLLSFTTLAGAWAADTYAPPTSQEFVSSIRGYPFVASAARRARIRAGVAQLTRCAPEEAVRNLIGNPDFGYLAYQAGTHGTVPTSRIWHYILEKKAPTEVEPSSSVVIWFDKGGKLKTVAVHGARDIESTVSRRAQECP
jgi:hypothetical protein